MTRTYHSLNIHYIFGTKGRRPLITKDLESRLWPFLGGILKQNNMKALCIGGVADHVHILASLPATLSVSKAVQLVKGTSSKWINDTFPELRTFRWQKGYGAFSVSVSHLAASVAYIKDQAEHHRTKTFKEEFLAFLEKHQIDYDARYLWE